MQGGAANRIGRLGDQQRLIGRDQVDPGETALEM